MNVPSMLEAAKIRDVAARHAYVFDNGLCSPDFFDVEKRMASEEFGLLRDRIKHADSVMEIGCFTGLNLLGLVKCGHRGPAVGIDFVWGAIAWAREQGDRSIDFIFGEFAEGFSGQFFKVICFDVLEHQLNVGDFLKAVTSNLADDGRALFLVPVGKDFYDCGHVAFFPDVECLHNVLDYYFDVEELFELKTSRKMFASCRKRA